MTFLKTRKFNKPLDLRKAVATVENRFGVSRYRQVAEIVRLALGAPKISVREYYELGAYNPELDWKTRSYILSDASSTILNRRLSPNALGAIAGVMRDKVLCGTILAAAGFPVPAMRALYSADGRYGRLADLRTPEEIAGWLSANDDWPIFGKPVNGSLGIGSASFIDCAGDELVTGAGQTVSAIEFARDIARLFPQGYLFQEYQFQHPEAVRLIGEAVGAFRIVTLRTADGIGVFYIVWKMPGLGSMANGVQANTGPSGMALVDRATGEITAAHFGDRLFGQDGATSPVTGARLVGARVPHFGEAVALAQEAHKLFPTHGVIGWDIHLRPDGPVIGEANPNPYHRIHQSASGRPIELPDQRAMLRAALDRVARRRRDARRRDVHPVWKM